MNKKSKASNYERELLSKFHELGFNGLRVAGSGSSGFPCPDLLVGRKGIIYAVEVKTSNKNFLHVKRNQLSELLTFCENLKIKPLIGVKFIKQTDWFFLPVNELFEKDSKNIRIDLNVISKGFGLKNF